MLFFIRFELIAQPLDIQRKSYVHENRWIKPTPLTIRIKAAHQKVPLIGATIQVKLGIALLLSRAMFSK